MSGSSRKRRGVAAVAAGVLAGGGSVIALLGASATPAFADSSPYELYCPGTPVGNIVLNNVVTTGTITPAAPAAGGTFNITNYQSTVALPTSIVGAAAALGNSAITGSAVLKVDATGATPASVTAPNITISAPIPSPVPAAGLNLVLPSTPGTVGPFTASGGTISLTVDPNVALTLVVSGSNLNITCHPYPNNTAATGIVTAAPAGSPASPVIATTSAGAAPTATTAPKAATPTTAAPTATTAAPAVAPSTSSLASTGPGPHLWVVAIVGFIVLYLGSVALAMVERPRSLLRRMLRLGRPVPAVAGPMDLTAPVPATLVDQAMVPVRPAATEAGPLYPRAGGSHGLWFDGLEPEDRTHS
jgi:hypothetical protein